MSNTATHPALSPVTVHALVTQPLNLTAPLQLDRWVPTDESVVEVVEDGARPSSGGYSTTTRWAA